ncbi:hypothetical protein [Jiangella asiatica]|uniref:Uncharacterized protein n=1 Tax=Jiangella asiatica TaxID=2530372 RepID=A0A4R5DG89_9ACTN|nr:hypothetical protein [Jiangella asiatica]TDE13022.1 hypothetical protein E1269_06410 [Jiangella asiatica]
MSLWIGGLSIGLVVTVGLGAARAVCGVALQAMVRSLLAAGQTHRGAASSARQPTVRVEGNDPPRDLPDNSVIESTCADSIRCCAVAVGRLIT